MKNFSHILNWKLKGGSHRFPGKDGGTCINEAALVACGFEYRAVRTVHDMPPCFSRPICRLAMMLNDQANDADRQQLVPFVTRLACADSPEVERLREALIQWRLNLHGEPWGSVPFDKGIQVLQEALALGRQAESVMFGDVLSRMETVKNQLRSTAGGRFASMLKSLLGLAKDPEPVG